MKLKILATIGIIAMAAGSAFAGLNPADPGLPTVIGGAGNEPAFAGDVPNNQISAMCVDCHTRQPKAGGTHFVNTAAGGETNSGGSGLINTMAAGARDGGEYFKTTAWASGWTSKYGRGIVSYSSALPTGAPAITAINATIGAIAITDDIICESCHNIVGNADGGDNLLVAQPKLANKWQDTATADICVGCHGFMYSSDDTQGGWTVTLAQNANAALALNDNDFGGLKGNNEYHRIQGAIFPQNHHVTTGDEISGVTAAVGVLWTDNNIISYSDIPMLNTSVKGSYGQRAVWDDTFAPELIKPSTGATAAENLSCTNCHAPAHGGSSGASILRGAIYTAPGATRTNPWDRISDAGAGWKKIDDNRFCGQCHE